MCKIYNMLAKITAKLSLWVIPALCAGAISSSALLAESWDIENTGQPFTEVDITLSEGTWMSVDVSPDGTSLAVSYTHLTLPTK
ncbi:MAG: hypothetical protein KUG56_09270, partial [Kordiimonadaceae bacterium]|nr:hypothetical protein [Kordiimonadaceae bacterium]